MGEYQNHDAEWKESRYKTIQAILFMENSRKANLQKVDQWFPRAGVWGVGQSSPKEHKGTIWCGGNVPVVT